MGGTRSDDEDDVDGLHDELVYGAEGALKHQAELKNASDLDMMELDLVDLGAKVLLTGCAG